MIYTLRASFGHGYIIFVVQWRYMGYIQWNNDEHHSSNSRFNHVYAFNNANNNNDDNHNEPSARLPICHTTRSTGDDSVMVVYYMYIQFVTFVIVIVIFIVIVSIYYSLYDVSSLCWALRSENQQKLWTFEEKFNINNDNDENNRF